MKKIAYTIILISVVLCSCSNNDNNYGKEYKWETRVNYFASEMNQDNTGCYTIQLLNDNKLMNSSMQVLPYLYFFCENAQGSYYYLNRKELGQNIRYKLCNIKKYLIDVYDIKTTKKVKTIDAKKILKKYTEIQASPFAIFGTAIIDGVPYVTVMIESIYNSDDDGNLYINLSDESSFYKMFAEDEEDNVTEIRKDDISQDVFFDQNTLDTGLKIVSNRYEGQVVLTADAYKMPQNNKRLYEMFPKLKENVEKLNKTNKKAEIDFMLSDDLTDEEILRLFVNDGQEISFDGVIVDAESSVDGLFHKVDSFEDFYKYTEPVEQFKPKYKPIIDAGGN